MTRLDYALQHVRDGFSVLPLWWVADDRSCACDPGKHFNPLEHSIGKHPIGTVVPNGHLNASTDPGVVRKWWTRYPKANIGVRIPDNAVLLDTDTDDGEATVRGKHDGEMPQTPTAKTGRGYHRLLAWPVGVPKPTSKTGKQKLLPGVDFKGCGFYVGAGSEHHSGLTYEWVDGLGPDVGLMPTPEWVVERIQKIAAESPSFVVPADGEVIHEGEGRANAVFAFVRSNRARGFGYPENEAAARAFNERVCRPPLTETELRKTIKNGLTLDDTAEFKERQREKEEADADLLVPIAGASDALPTPPPSEKRVPFPPDALTGLTREYADLMDPVYEAPRSHIGMAFEIMVGAALGGLVEMEGAESVPPRLYGPLVGPSGRSKKTSTLRKMTAFARKHVGEAQRPLIRPQVGSGEGLALEFQDVRDERKRTNNPLPPSVFIVLDEVRTFVQKASIPQATLMETVGGLYEQTEYYNRTKYTKIEIPEGHLALTGGCTPETYRSMFDAQFRGMGFVNRLTPIYDWSDKVIPHALPLPEEALAALGRRVTRLISGWQDKYVANGGAPSVLPVDADALALQAEWYDKNAGLLAQLDEADAEIQTRLDGVLKRKALLNALVDGDDRIRRPHMEAAIAFAEYQRQVRELLDPEDALDEVARMERDILKVLARMPGYRIARSDLSKYVNARRNKSEGLVTRALRNLDEAEFIDMPKKGRGQAIVLREAHWPKAGRKAA